MFGRLLVGLLLLFSIGWALIRADLVPDMHRAPVVGGARQPAYERLTAGSTGRRSAGAQ